MPCTPRVGGPGKTADSGHSISEAVQSIEAEPFSAFAWSANGAYAREDSQSRIMNLTASCLETMGATPLAMNAPNASARGGSMRTVTRFSKFILHFLGTPVAQTSALPTRRGGGQARG